MLCWIALLSLIVQLREVGIVVLALLDYFVEWFQREYFRYLLCWITLLSLIVQLREVGIVVLALLDYFVEWLQREYLLCWITLLK